MHTSGCVNSVITCQRLLTNSVTFAGDVEKNGCGLIVWCNVPSFQIAPSTCLKTTAQKNVSPASGGERCRVKLSLSQANGPPELLDVVLNNERDHRVRRDARIVRRESGPQPQRTASLHLLPRAVQGALERHFPRLRVGLHLLHLCLDVIEGKGEERREEACDGGCAEDLGGAAGCHASILQPLLRLRVETQHAEVQRHGAGRGGH